jgi:L-seryl-tRNA(Ser) seleniumtransferase
VRSIQALHEVVAGIARQAVEAARRSVSEGKSAPDEGQIIENVLSLAEAVLRPSLRPVINATGVIIHTNLGRAPLSEETIEAMSAASRGYSNLEFDLEAGERGSRYAHMEAALLRLTGAEAAMAVNNNASALLLTLSALCRDREVIISRGQAVEIGGGFRIPDVMRQSGARLVEVGTTNRTCIRDYEGRLLKRPAPSCASTPATSGSLASRSPPASSRLRVGRTSMACSCWTIWAPAASSTRACSASPTSLRCRRV